jgi:hypothetical protein
MDRLRYGACLIWGGRRVKGGHTNLQCCMILYDISQSLLVYEMKLMYVL